MIVTAVGGDFSVRRVERFVALACHAHGVPFYVAAPFSTIDLTLPSGERIPIEERPWEGGRYPAFDVTPARLISAIITERGVLRPPYDLSRS